MHLLKLHLTLNSENPFTLVHCQRPGGKPVKRWGLVSWRKETSGCLASLSVYSSGEHWPQPEHHPEYEESREAMLLSPILHARWLDPRLRHCQCLVHIILSWRQFSSTSLVFSDVSLWLLPPTWFQLLTVIKQACLYSINELTILKVKK